MDISLGARLAQYRKQNGFSQETLAEKLGLSRQAISKWERGESAPDTSNLIALSRIYGVTIDELLGNNLGQVSGDIYDEKPKLKVVEKTKGKGESADGKKLPYKERRKLRRERYRARRAERRKLREAKRDARRQKREASKIARKEKREATKNTKREKYESVKAAKRVSREQRKAAKEAKNSAKKASKNAQKSEKNAQKCEKNAKK